MSNELKCTGGNWRFVERSEVTGEPSEDSNIPFAIEATFTGHGSFCVPIADICNFPPSSKENIDIRRRDAALISAAPDLYNALLPFANMFGELSESKVQQGGIVYEHNSAKFTVADLLAASKAILKANPDYKP